MEITRLHLWLAYAVNVVLSVIYAALAFASFSNIIELKKHFDDSEGSKNAKEHLGGLQATLFLSAFFVCVFAVVCLFLMLGKLISDQGFGFTYGFSCSSAINLGIIMLISGIQMYFYRDYFKQYEDWKSWSSGKTSTFVVTLALAFILFVWYLGYFIFLLFVREVLDLSSTVKSAPNTSYKSSQNTAYGGSF
eukprot:TRINITY_DN1207_c0_g1_i3.p2 TRINITY_DN1207_c0_g1~~TRINITY_DN1207_c0_g1_i3.p2  ORF type:complete len:215 (-),score=11.03 TRINITY_DN1207_c0_g1_i3:975-1550(-)